MLIRRKSRSSSSKRKPAPRPRVERLEDRTLLSASFWSGFGGNAQHTAVSTVAAQPLGGVVWHTPIDLNPQYSGSDLLIHYGEPAVSQANTLIVPVKTGATGGFQIEAIDGYTGKVRWTLPTDYILPNHNWTPSFDPVMTSTGRVYFAGAGGTLYYFDNPDSATAPTVHQVAFFGLANYQANAAAYNSTVFIDTPLTADANGNVFFGFRVQGSAPAPVSSTQSGYARVDGNGNGTFALVGAMTGDSAVTFDSHNAAPALSNDGSTVYVLAKDSTQSHGYLVALNSTTLATKSKVFLADPRNGGGASILDDGTASPLVAPDNTVFIGVMGNPYNGSRGFMLHYSADLSQSFTPGAFGWDDTASIVPASMVPSYHGTSTYLLFTKYNNYTSLETGPTGGNGLNLIAVLDPYASQADTRNDAIPPNGSNDPGLQVMKEVLTIAGPTPDPEFVPQDPQAVREWCINSSVVDPATDSVYAGSEDGKMYQWNLGTGTFTAVVTLTTGIGEAYTPTWMGPDGKVYGINNATVFAIGGSWNNFGGNPQHTEISNVPAQPIDTIHWSVNIDQGVQSGVPIHYGEPVFTPNNTVIIPVKTGPNGTFQLQARNGATGALLWTVSTDYQEPPFQWLPPFQPVYSAADNRVYFAGNGGTIYYINNPDSAGATISGQFAFYGISNYAANPSAYNSTVEIDSPLTVDANGTVYFGFMVTGSNPSGLTGGGIARVATTGAGTYALAANAVGGGDPTITRAALGSAPALSNDGSILYVAVNGTGSGQGDAYLLGLNSTTLATVYNSGRLLDPRSTSLSNSVIDESTASPMVAPDGTVFFGTFANLNNFNGSRGFLLHFSGNLTQEFTPGAFGWDDTVSIIPASMVPSYHGTSTYLVLAKYNNYAAAETGASGGNGVNEIAILDPYATEPDPNNDAIPPNGVNDPSLLVMKEILTITSPTPDTDFTTKGFPDAVREWCTDGTAVDPFTDSVFINNEDGFAYRWNLATNTLSEAVQISPGIGEPYTPTSIGPDGTVYAINGGTLFALGGFSNYTLTNTSSANPSQFGQPVTFTTTLASTNGGAVPTGTVTYEDGSTVLGTVTLSGGVATFTTAGLGIAHHDITAVYSGDTNYSTGQTILVQPVLDETSTNLTSSANPSQLGQAITLTATVAPQFGTSFVPIGTVTFMDGTTVLGTAQLNASDQATLVTSSLTGGQHNITAVYGGDLNFVGGTSNVVQQTVSATTSFTSLISSLDPSNYGQSVTFTATVTSDPPSGLSPTGTITFMDGSTVLATATLSNGVASYTTSALVSGSHSITAVYGGDNNYSPSTSPTLTQTVIGTATTTSVASSANPSAFGQGVTFTATVSTSSGTPTGTVTFKDGTTVLGTGSLTAGMATFSTSALIVGGHTITAVYGGDAAFQGSTSSALTQTVNQDGTTTGVSSSVNPSSFGQSVTFTATVTASSPGAGTPTGTVTFKDGTTVLGTGSLTAGVATFATSTLSIGGHSITATYGGDSSFTGSASATLTQTVNANTTTTGLTSSANPSSFGQSVTFTATVTAGNGGTPTGTVTFKDGSTVLGTGTLSAGVATFATSSLTVGGHTITAVYGGDATYTGSTSAAVTQTVNADGSGTALSSSVNPSAFGQSVTFTATVTAASPGSGTPTGTVTFKDGSTVLGTGSLTAGVATFATSSLTVGGHSITAVYGGDGNFTGSTSTATTQTVNQDGSATALSSSVNPSAFGQSVTFTATVTAGSPGAGTPTGTVTFKDGSTVLGTGTLSAGVATFATSSLTVGGHSITAVYGGDGNFTGSTSSATSQAVNADGSATALSSSANPSAIGQSVTFTATVTAASPGAGTPTGSVTFKDGGIVLGTGTLSGGVATFTTSSLSVGGHSISASYGGDGNFTASASTTTGQTVNPDGTSTGLTSSVNPSAFGQSVTFTATISAASPGAGTPTGTVTFKDGATVLGTGSLTAGVATFTTSALAVGGHSITASYGGDGNFTGSTSATTTQTVNQAGTATGLSSSVNPSAFGQSVTFTATVSASSPGAGTPTGTVAFKDGATVLGTGSLSGGVATFATSSLTVGGHTITAVYGGDGNFTGSTSTATTQTVNADGSGTALSSSVNPSAFGQSVTFTATVSASGPGAGTPTGTVTFKDGSTVLGSGTLSAGVATFSTSSLSVSGHAITAVYGGDGNFTGSTSTTTTQTVNQAGTATAVAASPNPSAFGQSVTFTATITVVGPGTGTPTGSVTFMDGSTVLGTGTLSGGVATFSTSSLSVAGHTITASYGGDGNFAGSTSSSLTQTVNPDGTTSAVASSLNPSNSGQSVTFTAMVTANGPGAGTPTGSVTFLDGTTVLGTGTLSGGAATFSTSTLGVGSHAITVSYAGDGSFATSQSSALTQVVVSANGTTTTLKSSADPSLFNQWVTFTATVKANTGTTKPTGTVTFLDGTTVLGTGTLSGGNATFMIKTLSVGDHSITASYGGSSTFGGSTSAPLTQTVSVDGTTTSVVASPNPSVSGQNVTFTATVKPVAPGSGTPTGGVQFFDGTTLIGSGTLSSGRATFTTNALAVGGHTITVQYAGDGNYSSSTSTGLADTVNQASTTAKVTSSGTTAVFGQTVTFTATITAKSPGTGTPTGMVTFLDGTTVLGTAGLTGGKATFATSSLTIGSHSITVSYGGDGNFLTSTSTAITQTVNQASTTTAVTSSANPSTSGQPVSFTAIVTPKSPGAGVPTGSVTFKDGGVAIGTVTLVNGQAVFTTSSLSVGNHTITAVYNGDVDFKTSTSSSFTQKVNTGAAVVVADLFSAALPPAGVTADVARAIVAAPALVDGLADTTALDQFFAALGTESTSGSPSKSK